MKVTKSENKVTIETDGKEIVILETISKSETWITLQKKDKSAVIRWYLPSLIDAILEDLS